MLHVYTIGIVVAKFRTHQYYVVWTNSPDLMITKISHCTCRSMTLHIHITNHSLCVQGSHYVWNTSVSYSQGSVLSTERISCAQTAPCYADGYGEHTVWQMLYVSDRFGPASSWSSAYRADTWNLNIERKNSKRLPKIVA